MLGFIHDFVSIPDLEIGEFATIGYDNKLSGWALAFRSNKSPFLAVIFNCKHCNDNCHRQDFLYQRDCDHASRWESLEGWGEAAITGLTDYSRPSHLFFRPINRPGIHHLSNFVAHYCRVSYPDGFHVGFYPPESVNNVPITPAVASCLLH